MAYYVAAGRWSGIVGVVLAETSNGNFLIHALPTFIPQNANETTCTVAIKIGDQNRRFFCVFDKKQHNDGTNKCPYLVFSFCHSGYDRG